jgi:hypothetical protein
MRARPDEPWLTLGALLAGALLPTAACLGVLRPAGLPAWCYLVLVPALIYTAPLVLPLCARLDTTPERPSAGELDHLLELNRTGSLPPARRAAPRPGGRLRSPVASSPAVAVNSPGALDRLVERKRVWAQPDSPGPGKEDPKGSGPPPVTA